ncbi:MAG: hypothetical protein LBK25_06680 [Treponema sp.]|jgi:hypothetical protein|nr:hypothetical protein [Treponema sp.]
MNKYKPIIILFALWLAACGSGATNTEVYYADVVWTDFKGEWMFIGPYGTDGYTIGSVTLSYEDGTPPGGEWDSDFTADIVHCYKFVIFNAETTTDSINASVKDGSGVFIVRLSTGANTGKYTAVYFRNLRENPKSAEMATAYYDEQFPYCFDTPNDAVDGFVSLSAMNKYVSMWGVYTKTGE